MSRILTLIPARGGSKSVPRKNLRLVGGKPLIQWTIEAAKLSKYPLDIYCTTDDSEIADVAKKFGVEVVIRPAGLAGDTTPMIDTVRHALAECERSAGQNYDCVLLLQPTAPLRISSDIDNAMDMWSDLSRKSILSVYKVEDAHPARMYQVACGALRPLIPEPASLLRQDLPDVYHRNGAIYLAPRELIVNENVLIGSEPIPCIMPKSRSINIDDLQDLLIADYLLSRAGIPIE